MASSAPPDTLSIAGLLASRGVSVHWLHPKTKRPIGDDWSTKPFNLPHMLRNSYRPGNNLGIRLGEPSKIGDLFLHVIDLDIRVSEKAGDALGIVERRAEGDLKRFKSFIEERGTETGGWRGEVRPGDQA